MKVFVFFRKGKTSSEPRQSTSRAKDKSAKTDYGSWGPIYKNKQNFIDMHNCWKEYTSIPQRIRCVGWKLTGFCDSSSLKYSERRIKKNTHKLW